jgi:chemotaxis methyl-accepting protein methylase
MTNRVLEHSRVRALIEARFGLTARSVSTRDIDRALAELAREEDLAECDLVARLAEPSLLRALAGKLTINESHFLRHEAQLAHVVHWLGQSGARGKSNGPPALWSGGCSRGEEPYSVAMLLRDAGLEGLGVRMTASDLDNDAVAQASSGRYGAWSLRHVPSEFIGRHFTVQGNEFSVLPRYLDKVTFSCASLQETLHATSASGLDVILFRNVGIYLSAQALSAFHFDVRRVLKPGGLLVLAPTDPRPPTDVFHWKREVPVGVYQFAPEGIPRRSLRPPPRRSLRAHRRHSLRPHHPGPPPVSPVPKADATTPAVARSLAQLRAEVDRDSSHGRHAAALIPIDAALASTPASVDLLLLRGQVLFAQGKAEDALASVRKALYYAPAHRLARYWHLLTLRRVGAAPDRVAALGSDLERSLAAVRSDVLLEDGETTISDLREALEHLRVT